MDTNTILLGIAVAVVLIILYQDVISEGFRDLKDFADGTMWIGYQQSDPKYCPSFYSTSTGCIKDGQKFVMGFYPKDEIPKIDRDYE